MTFEEIEQSVLRELNNETMNLPELECFYCLQRLYDNYRKGQIDAKQAGLQKKVIRQQFNQANLIYFSRTAAYAQYQEAIQLASGERERLPLIAQSGSWEMVARSALRVISAMTGETVTEKTVLKQLEAHHDRQAN